MRALFTLLSFLVTAYSAISQQRSFIEYPTSSGLVQSQVRAIGQDHTGALWLGTLGGLSRFDGFVFENFSVDDGLHSNRINCFHKSETNFWIGTTGGVSRLKGGVFETIALPDNYERSEVFDILETHPDTLWLALAGDGLLLYSNGGFKHFGLGNGLPDLYIRALSISSRGVLHVGTKNGLFIKKGDQFFEHPNEILRSASISDLHFSKSDELLVCTYGNGVLMEFEGQFIAYDSNSGINTNHVRCITELPNGIIWFGSKRGLLRFEDGKFDLIDESSGMPYDNVKSLGTDSEGNLWVGTDGKGALMLAGEAFTSFKKSDGLSSELSISICNLDSGGIAIGSYDNGISIYDGKNFREYAYNNSLPGKTVWSLLSGADNSLWVGTNLGLFYEHKGDFLTIDKNHGLPGNSITTLHKSGDTLWVGMDEGLVLIDAKNKKVVSVNSNVRDIRTIKNSSLGLLIGGSNAVYNLREELRLLHRFDIGRDVYCLEEVSEGGIWIGTSDGLFFYEDGKIIERDFSDVISAKNINFLKLLEDSTLLVGTNNGLYRINTGIVSENPQEGVTHYGRYEGLVSSETNQNAVYSKGNKVWFGTTGGPIIFFPKLFGSLYQSAPRVNFNEVQLFLQKTDWSKFKSDSSEANPLPLNPVLASNQNYLTFKYSGILFSNPSKLRYRYKLAGADDNWLGPTDARSVTYAYLPHGDYTFYLEAFSIDAPSVTNQVEWSFTILPPFYLTNWFFISCFILIVGIIYWLYQIRIKKERAKNAALQLEYQSRLLALESQSLNSSMNRHFIFNALNSIQYYINVQDRRSANKYLTSFAKLIRYNLDSSQQAQTSLNEELKRLELYLSLEQMRFQGRFEYFLNVSEEVNAEEVSLPSMMLQPFLENSIWHGILPSDKPGRINLNINQQEGNLNIEIEDNGIGYDISMEAKKTQIENHNSHGMSITRNRMSLYQRMTGNSYEVLGPQQIENDKGEVTGTRVVIKIPFVQAPENNSLHQRDLELS